MPVPSDAPQLDRVLGLTGRDPAWTAPNRAGFGSVPVRVTIGASTWSTSLFPDKAAESFVLPVKKPVRSSEALEAGDTVTVTLELATIGGSGP